MKISLENKGHVVITSVLVAAFFVLHYYVYLDNASGEVPIIQSYTDAPVDLPELSLCEEKKPTYFNPFLKVTFSYRVEQNDSYSECNIIEQAESMLTSKMQPLVDDPYNYYDGFDEDGFGRPQVGYTYANVLFFIVQYLIIAAFVLVLLKPEKIRAIGYEIFIDPLLGKVRGLISSFVPENSKVIDIGCGTGALAFRLAEEKGCAVRGVDLAHNKIERAKQKVNSSRVQFSEADATNLSEISDQKFDCATISLFLHSLPENSRHLVLQEAMRVAKRIIIADFATTQPRSFSGLAVRGIERIAGGEHFQSFNQFRASGGLEPLLKETGLVIMAEQLNPSKTVRVVVVERQNLK